MLCRVVGGTISTSATTRSNRDSFCAVKDSSESVLLAALDAPDEYGELGPSESDTISTLTILEIQERESEEREGGRGLGMTKGKTRSGSLRKPERVGLSHSAG